VGLIYLDSCLVIYLVEDHPRWGELLASAIAQAEEARFGVSPLVKCECLVGPTKRGDPVLERAYGHCSINSPSCRCSILSFCWPRAYVRISA
jgi:hypothetical protein